MRDYGGFFYLIAILLFACVLIFLNELAPLVSDDYVYSFVYDAVYYIDDSFSQRLYGLKDIWDSQIAHYQSWGGRMAAHTLAQFFLLYGSGLMWSIANTLCLFGCIYLMLQVSGAKWKGRWDVYLLTLCLYWSLLPCPGQTHIWLTGSCNYQWALLCVLAFLHMWRHLPCRPSYAWFIYPIALLAGNFQEALSPGIAVCLLFYAAFNHKTTTLHQWCGLAVFVVGVATNVLAPGNQVRLEQLGYSGGFIHGIVRLALGIVCLCENFIYNPAAWLLPLAALLCCLFQIRKKQYSWNMFFVVAAGTSLLAAIYSNNINVRSTFGMFCYSYISIIPLLLTGYDKLQKQARMLLTGTLLLYSAWLMCQAGYSLHRVDMCEQAIAKSASEGNTRITITPSIDYATDHPLWNLNCTHKTFLNSEKENIHNRAFATYYNISEFGLATGDFWEQVPDNLDEQFATLAENSFVRINPHWVLLHIRGNVTAIQAAQCHIPNDNLDKLRLYKRRTKGWVINPCLNFQIIHKDGSSFILVNCQPSPSDTPLEINVNIMRGHLRERVKFSLSEESGKVQSW